MDDFPTQLKLLRTSLRRAVTPRHRQLASDARRIAESGLFSADWYLDRYPDVARSGIDPLQHFVTYGGGELRDPSPAFNAAWYVTQLGEFERRRFHPLLHYLEIGRARGLPPLPHRLPGAAPSLDAPEGLSECEAVAVIRASARFDADWYRATHAGIVPEGVDPALHYLRHGAALGLDPSERFDTAGYLACYPDVARSGANPLLHFALHSKAEGRSPTPRRIGGDYAAWIERFDYRPERDRAGLERAVAELPHRPTFSIVMPVYDPPLRLLDEAIASVVAQIYPNWQLCIADDASTDPAVREVIEAWRAHDPRIAVVLRPENGHIARASNSALEIATGEWIALLDHDDLLAPHALAEIALEVVLRPGAELVYSDEDKIDETGRRFDPFFKPGFSPELFRSQHYLSHLTVHRADNVRAVGGFRPGFEGSQDYDLSLRVYERVGASGIRRVPRMLYHWRATAGSTARAVGEKNYAFDAGLRALREHLDRTGFAADVERSGETPYYRVRPALPDEPPLVSLIVPTRDRVDLLAPCVRSILEKTVYPNYEIVIVDNGSTDPDTIAFMAGIVAQDARVRVHPYPGPFNYSAINNAAVAAARGTLIGLVNNDVEVIAPDWLGEMVGWAIRPEIGCVGAKLCYPNDTIQHAGIVLGLGGVADHPHRLADRDAHGYFDRLRLVQNVSAVTGACLVVRKAVFEQVGGLDATNLAVAFNDVDFCLRVSEAGYRHVWTPHAELYHHESPSRGLEDTPEKKARFDREIAYMERRWPDRLVSDPFYSPHFSLTGGGYCF